MIHYGWLVYKVSSNKLRTVQGLFSTSNGVQQGVNEFKEELKQPHVQLNVFTCEVEWKTKIRPRVASLAIGQQRTNTISLLMKVNRHQKATVKVELLDFTCFNDAVQSIKWSIVFNFSPHFHPFILYTKYFTKPRIFYGRSTI